MTLSEIKALLGRADPDIRHYFSMSDAEAYTYWTETQQLALTADDKHDEGWRFYVHRFTRDENDATAAAIFSALDGDPRIAVRRRTEYERDSGYIHHIYECEGY